MMISNISQGGAQLIHAAGSTVGSILSSPAFVSVCGRLAPIAGILVLTSPVPTINKIKREKSVGNLPLLPYTSMALSTLLWTAYGLLRKEPSVWMTNLFGCVCGLYYFDAYSKYVPQTDRRVVQQHRKVMVATFVVTTLLFFKGSVDIIGSACVAFCLALFASPLAAVKTVVETKSAKSIPLPFTLASIFSAFCWTIFGLFKMADPKIYRTNALGFSLALIQVALKLIYRSGGRVKENDAISSM